MREGFRFAVERERGGGVHVRVAHVVVTTYSTWYQYQYRGTGKPNIVVVPWFITSLPGIRLYLE